jgi:hypothetical protein
MTANDLPDRLAQLLDREVPAEELHDALTTPLSDDERAHTQELVRWFRSRYPTPLERLAYVRQAYRRWTAGRQ